MAESEERLLEDYFQKIAAEAEEISDVKLDTAIRKGMQGGNRKRISYRTRYTVLLVAVLAIALLVIVPWTNQITHPVRAQLPPKSWGELEVFRSVVEDNITIRSALDAGMVKQMTDSTIEADGLVFTINGIIADRRGFAVLFTLQNNTDQKVQSLGLSMKRDPVSIYNISGYSSFRRDAKKEDGSPGESRMFEQIVWDKYQKELPEQLILTLSVIPVSEDNSILGDDIKRTELSIEITMDAEKDYFQGEVVDLNESLSIAGQKINMDQIYIGPTGIYMRESYDGDNTMKIFSMLSPKLIIGKEDVQEELMWASGASSVNGGLQTTIYHNDNMRPDDPIKLKIEGITALDKSKLELVINTETRQILKAPNEYFAFSKRMDNEEQGVFSLELFTPKNDEKSLTGSFFSLDDNFVDNTGSGHWLERAYDNDGNGYKERGDTKGSTTSAVFNVGKEKLPQPLTFKFTAYPNVVMESATLRIK